MTTLTTDALIARLSARTNKQNQEESEPITTAVTPESIFFQQLDKVRQRTS